MTALVMSTKSFLQDFVVGWAMATGKIRNSYKKVAHIAERIGTDNCSGCWSQNSWRIPLGAYPLQEVSKEKGSCTWPYIDVFANFQPLI